MIKKSVGVLKIQSSESKGVTLTLDTNWGPIVKADSVDEAKEKLDRAFLGSLLANTYWSNLYEENDDDNTVNNDPSKTIDNFRQRLEKV